MKTLKTSFIYCFIFINLFIINGNKVIANIFNDEEKETSYYINLSIEQVNIFDCYLNYSLFLKNVNVSSHQDTCFSSPYFLITAGDESYFISEENSSLKLVAGLGIRMLPGTYIKSGSYLQAFICQEGIYCEENYDHFLKTDQDQYKVSSVDQDFLNINEKKEKFFRVYPNPSNNIFYIDIFEYDINSFIEIKIYNTQGKVIKFQRITAQSQISIDLSNYHTGLYLLRVKDQNRVQVKRIVKF